MDHVQKVIERFRVRHAHYAHGHPKDVIVGLGGQFFLRKNSQDAMHEFHCYLDNGHGPGLEEFTSATPLTVGSPQQVIEETLSFKDHVGHCQRRLFLFDHAVLPLKMIVKQMDLLGEILPELRKGFAEGRPADTPDAPTYDSLVACSEHSDGYLLLPVTRSLEHPTGIDMKIVAISAGLGQPSSTRMLVDCLVAQITQDLPNAEAEVMEVRDLGHDLLNAEFTGVRSVGVTEALESIAGADGLLAVSPVFNAHAAAVFHLLFEVLDVGALEGKPVLVGATGGTVRHSLVMDRDIVASLHYHHALVSPVSVFAATEDWGNPSALDRRIQRAARTFVRVLAGWNGVSGSEVAAGDDSETDGRKLSGPVPDDGLGPVQDFEDMFTAFGH